MTSRAVVLVIVWLLDLQQPVQSVPITRSGVNTYNDTVNVHISVPIQYVD
jgi:hypothetical protein